MDIENLCIAKSALAEQNLQCKIGLGAKIIEIQLLDELLHKDANSLFLENRELFEKFPIAIIHTPLYDTDETNVEYANEEKLFFGTCELAQKTAEIKNKDILVVVHVVNSPIQMEKLGILQTVLDRINKALEMNKNIRIGIENTSPYKFYDMPDCGKITFTDSQQFRGNELQLASEELVKIIDHDRVGAVIDTCHALMTHHFLNMMGIYADSQYVDFSDTYTKILNSSPNKTFLYHLSYTKYAGVREHHGLPIDIDNQREHDFLEEFFNLYIKKHPNINIPITLEVRENDFFICQNYEQTRKSVLAMIDELKIRRICEKRS